MKEIIFPIGNSIIGDWTWTGTAQQQEAPEKMYNRRNEEKVRTVLKSLHESWHQMGRRSFVEGKIMIAYSDYIRTVRRFWKHNLGIDKWAISQRKFTSFFNPRSLLCPLLIRVLNFLLFLIFPFSNEKMLSLSFLSFALSFLFPMLFLITPNVI